jgi:hypothetical protein
MTKGENLADDHHVLRYVKPTQVDRVAGVEQVSFSTFLCRADEDDCSVNWMEYFDAPVANQCACIRAEKRVTYKAAARVARLNVGVAKTKVLAEAETVLAFIHDPEEPEPPRFPKPQASHSIITGMPKLETPEGEMVGALLRDIIPNTDIYAVTAG